MNGYALDSNDPQFIDEHSNLQCLRRTEDISNVYPTTTSNKIEMIFASVQFGVGQSKFYKS